MCLREIPKRVRNQLKWVGLLVTQDDGDVPAWDAVKGHVLLHNADTVMMVCVDAIAPITTKGSVVTPCKYVGVRGIGPHRNQAF